MAAVPGSTFRRALFWVHLACGVAAGVLILVMSVTGVLLTYERQMIEAAAKRNHVELVGVLVQLDADRLAEIALRDSPSGSTPSLVFDADPTAPVTIARGRDGSVLLNPYDGTVIDDASSDRRGFFRLITEWHRWLGASSRSTAAALIDYANLAFLFLIVSGVYVWLPQVWRWRTVRGLVLFQKHYVNAKARDFNWHHVFSVWGLIPLLIISLSGVVISFDWANRALYGVFGEQAPQRRGPPGGGSTTPDGRAIEPVPARRASFETLRQAAASQAPSWQRITLPLVYTGPRVAVTVDLQSRTRRAPRQTLVLDAADGSVLEAPPPPDPAAQSPGQRARTWMRFAHTGEQFGLAGQTIAGLASLAACFLVYTGFALAWRRLIQPLFRRPAR